MKEIDNTIPTAELHCRWQRYRDYLARYQPEAEGALLFSRLNIYYFTGTFANGVLWLPRQGEPILFCRRGAARAKIETPLQTILGFHSYRDLEPALAKAGMALPTTIAAEMNGLPWTLANSLQKTLPTIEFLPTDRLLALTRSLKSDWELQILRRAGAKHDQCLTRLLPPLLQEGMSELEIAHLISDLFFRQGHLGILRMETFGEQAFLGHIAIGDSANYPSVFNGPVDLVGAHPSAPFMGSDRICWQQNSLLTIDNGFTLAGYQTDKTQVYWLGPAGNIPADVQRAHDFCIDLQAMVAEQLRPGAIPAEIWADCEETVAASPWEEGFMGLGENKVGFIGHGIGLAIDEYPVLAKGFDLPLEQGMALAVEPKIGIPGIGMVGTENTFEVTEQGGRSLTGEQYGIITVES